MTDDNVASPRVAQVERLLEERERLIHDLEVHQVELEVQNQQLREAQHLLEESRARYSDLYDFAPVSYCTLDPAGCIVEINLTGAAMLGTPRGHVIGKPFAVYVAEADRTAFRTHLQRRLSSTHGEDKLEFTLAGPAKPPVVIGMVSAVALDQTGTIVGCRSAFTDISERKRAEESLRVAVRMREDFLAIVSHDLRNPLNSIMLGSAVLKKSPTLDARSLSHVDIIGRAATRMDRMLSDLLDLSSMDAGHLSMERGAERVESLLSVIVENTGPAANAKSIRLETALDDPQLVAYCDRDRILQVLMNLVGNAIKFSRVGACVRIEAKRTLGAVELSVHDSSVGIAKAQLDHIFDPYWQGAKTAKLGTGLGLSIARGIIEFHGGRIWVESVVDRGSSFYFTLPSAPIQRANVEEWKPRLRRKSGPLSGNYPVVDESVPLTPAERRRPILIVDDEADVHDLLTDLLRAEGYDVVTASDGAEALEYLRAAPVLPGMILLDLVMPNMDGWEFLEQRSHDPRLAGIPIVLISGQTSARETARALGLASFVEKPIVAARLREVLTRMHEDAPTFG
jgi:PAS domain S-box-containing protein